MNSAAEFDFEPKEARASRSAQVKTVLAEACLASVNKAMEVCGGQAFFRKTGIEQLLRDVGAASYRPLQPKRQHLFSGRVALGMEPIWALAADQVPDMSHAADAVHLGSFVVAQRPAGC